MQPFLAMISPVGGGPVDPGFGVPGWPTHPIAPGGPPPGIWPGPGYPSHPIAPGGPPPGIWPSPGYPSHPIAPGGSPPGIWGGPPSYVDIGGPGWQPGIWGGGNVPMPTPPIYIPLPPGEKPPEPGNGLSPTHPIVIPPTAPATGEKALVHVYVVGVGGVWFLIQPPPAAPTHPIAEQPPGTPKK
jgi:hypothetical protein